MSLRRVLAAIPLAALSAAPCPLAAQRAVPLDATSAVTGIVYDSVGHKPLAGAIVQLASRSVNDLVYNARTDASGAFRIDGVRSGSYMAGFLHPVLDTLGLDDVTRIIGVGADSVTRVNLGTPSLPALRARLCDARSADDATGMLMGFVHDADDGVPLPGSVVTIMWDELVLDHGLRQRQREALVTTNDKGWYAICGVPTNGALLARATFGERTSGYIELSVAPRSLLHRNFGIPPDSAAVLEASASPDGRPVRRGTARVTGIVRNTQGKPLAGAQVTVWGAGSVATTGDDGKFALAELPAGTQTLEVREVGYAIRRLSVDLMSQRATSANVLLERNIDLLSAVKVYGDNARLSEIIGFYQRQHEGNGYFITRQEIEQRSPGQLTDILRSVPGVEVVNVRGFSQIVRMNGDCQPAFYVDGAKIADEPKTEHPYLVAPAQLDSMGTILSATNSGTLTETGIDVNALAQPADIAGIEVYNAPTATPLPFRSTQGCGSIVIWTGRGLVTAKN